MVDGLHGLELMERANPWLFSQDSYEEYPLEYEELKHYLANDIDATFPHRNSKPYTDVDYLDFLLYKKGDSGSGIDLDKKLICEYALYQVQSHKRLGKLKESSSITLEQLINVEALSAEWFQYMAVLLEEINATNVEVPLFDIGSVRSNKNAGTRGLQRSNTTIRTNGALQELTSFVLSSAVKKGIELKPVNMDNPIEFLKNAIDSLTAYSQDNGDLEAKKEDDIYKQKEDLETAFKDLQLAHSFLTKQFEKDRAEYLQNIEKIQETNKELQQKNTISQNNLIESKSRLGELEREMAELRSTNRRNSEKIKSLNLSSPIPTPDYVNLESPTLSGNGHSFSIMRAEFKRMFAESQRKYEKEVQEERESRLLLQKELEALKRSSGMK